MDILPYILPPHVYIFSFRPLNYMIVFIWPSTLYQPSQFYKFYVVDFSSLWFPYCGPIEAKYFVSPADGKIVFYNQINDLLGYNLYIYVYHFHLSLIGKSYELFVLIIKFIKNNVIIIESCYAFILGRLYFLMRARLPRIRYIS